MASDLTGSDTSISAAVSGAGDHYIKIENGYYTSNEEYSVIADYPIAESAEQPSQEDNSSETSVISYTLPTQMDLSNGDTCATITASSALDIDDVILTVG